MSVRSTHNRVAQALAERILGGELTPGSILPPEIELSRRLGISRSVLREAFKILSAKGMLDSRPKLGTRVRPKSCWSLLDPTVLDWAKAGKAGPALALHMLELRLLVEPPAAGFAATRRRPHDLERIGTMIDRIEAAASGIALEAALGGFREAILQASRNDLLYGFQTLPWTSLDSATLWEQKNEALHRCQAILAAITSEDSKSAETAMRELVLFVNPLNESVI